MVHGDDLIEWSIDVISVSIDTQFHGGRLSDAAIIIRFDDTVLGVETNLVAVGGDGGCQSTPVVASPTNHHKTAPSEKHKISALPNPRKTSFGFKLILSLGRFDVEFACLSGDNGILINILGKNVIIIISDIVGRDMNDSTSGSVGNVLIIVFHSRWMMINRKWRHDFLFKQR